MKGPPHLKGSEMKPRTSIRWYDHVKVHLYLHWKNYDNDFYKCSANTVFCMSTLMVPSINHHWLHPGEFPRDCSPLGQIIYLFFFPCPAFFFNAIKRISCEQLHGFVIRGVGCHKFQTDQDYIVWTAEWQNENTNLNNKTNKGKKEIVYPALAYFSVAFGCLCSFPRLY